MDSTHSLLVLILCGKNGHEPQEEQNNIRAEFYRRHGPSMENWGGGVGTQGHRDLGTCVNSSLQIEKVVKKRKLDHGLYGKKKRAGNTDSATLIAEFRSGQRTA